MALGLSQAAVGARMGMNQSEVSRLERRRDIRVSTLRSYLEAIGGQLRMMATWPDRFRQYELVVGDSNLEHQSSRSRTRESAPPTVST
jgi:transcriptional regulator with XRE-family HTH domain